MVESYRDVNIVTYGNHVYGVRQNLGEVSVMAGPEELQKRYFDVVYGRNEKYEHWLTRV